MVFARQPRLQKARLRGKSPFKDLAVPKARRKNAGRIAKIVMQRNLADLCPGGRDLNKRGRRACFPIFGKRILRLQQAFWLEGLSNHTKF